MWKSAKFVGPELQPEDTTYFIWDVLLFQTLLQLSERTLLCFPLPPEFVLFVLYQRKRDDRWEQLGLEDDRILGWSSEGVHICVCSGGSHDWWEEWGLVGDGIMSWFVLESDDKQQEIGTLHIWRYKNMSDQISELANSVSSDLCIFHLAYVIKCVCIHCCVEGTADTLYGYY
jgi:hypothetical protein